MSAKSRSQNDLNRRKSAASAAISAEGTATGRLLRGVVVGGVAMLLCLFFWWPLFLGGGLMGGDLYSYYFPQKVYLSQSLKQGIIPLWNALVGFGYPILGESQTAALSPWNLWLYSWLEVNAAYNVSQLLHYVMAFVGMFLLARRWNLQAAGSLLVATTFVFGWFPPRICLEWAVIGGCWFAWILWGATAFFQTGKRRHLLWTAVFLALDLLAGHYHLAFITLLALLPLPWLMGSSFRSTLSESSPVTSATSSQTPNERALWISRSGKLVAAVVCGFLLAGVQLLPSWELKSLSQRQQVSDVFVPAYGHLPPQALTQLFVPWRWYAGDKTMDEQLAASRWLAVPAATNQVEAQLYLGLATILLALTGLLWKPIRVRLCLQFPWRWLLLTLFSLVLASGWPTYLLPGVPGLNFFRGAGRYSLIAAWTISMLAGATLDALLQSRPRRNLLAAGILLFTAVDLWLASRQYQLGSGSYIGRQVFYATLVDFPPVNEISRSPLREFLQKAGPACRLYGPGPNTATMLDVSQLPVYLGLGPEIYESPLMRVDFEVVGAEEIETAVGRLKRFGVTHLLLDRTLPAGLWPVTFRGAWIDPLLNSAWGRREPWFLYEIDDSPGRVSVEPLTASGPLSPEAVAESSKRIRSVQIEPNRVRVEVECDTDCRLVLRDLFYPGWMLKDGRASERYDELFRSVKLKQADSVDGVQQIEWVYRPASLLWGSIASLLGMIGLGILWYFLR